MILLFSLYVVEAVVQAYARADPIVLEAIYPMGQKGGKMKVCCMVEGKQTLRRPVGVEEGECKRSKNQSSDVVKNAGKGKGVSAGRKERRTREKYQVRFIID